MKRLFVPLKKMPDIVKELNKKKGVLWEVYMQVSKKFIKEER